MSSTSFSSTGTDTEEGMKLEAEISGTPGSVNLFAEATGSIGAGFRDVGRSFDGTEETVIIDVSVSGVNEFSRRVRRQVNALSSVLGTVPNRFTTSPRNALPDRLKNPGSIGGYITPTVLGQALGPPTDDAVYDRTVEFTPITIPTFENFDDSAGILPDDVKELDLAQLPDLEMTFEVRPKEVLQRTFGRRPRVKLTLTGRALVQTVSIGALDCSELFSDIEQRLGDIPTRITRTRSTIENTNQELRSIEQRFERVAGGETNITNITVEDIISIGRSSLSNIKSNVESLDPQGRLKETPSDIRNDLEDIADEVDNIGIPNCREELRDGIPRMLNTLDRLSNLLDSAEERQSRLLSILRGIESPDCRQEFQQIAQRISDMEQMSLSSDMTESQLRDRLQQVNNLEDDIQNLPRGDPCRDEFLGDVSSIRGDINELIEGAAAGRISQVRQELLNAIAGFEQDVRDFLDKDRLQRQPERRESLISEGERIRARIRGSGDLTGSQKDRLLNRVNSPLSRVRGAGVRTPEALPCGSRFSEVDDEIDDYRNEITSLRPPIEPDELNRIVRRGENVVNSIENEVPADSRCRREFVDEVRALTDRAQSFTARVRVETQTAEQAKDRSEELINQLLGQLESVQTGGNVEADVDIPST